MVTGVVNDVRNFLEPAFPRVEHGHVSLVVRESPILEVYLIPTNPKSYVWRIENRLPI
jgi:hypothetical protein